MPICPVCTSCCLNLACHFVLCHYSFCSVLLSFFSFSICVVVLLIADGLPVDARKATRQKAFSSNGNGDDGNSASEAFGGGARDEPSSVFFSRRCSSFRVSGCRDCRAPRSEWRDNGMSDLSLFFFPSPSLSHFGILSFFSLRLFSSYLFLSLLVPSSVSSSPFFSLLVSFCLSLLSSPPSHFSSDTYFPNSMIVLVFLLLTVMLL